MVTKPFFVFIHRCLNRNSLVEGIGLSRLTLHRGCSQRPKTWKNVKKETERPFNCKLLSTVNDVSFSDVPFNDVLTIDMSSNSNKVVQLHREALSRQTQQDWANREYVELISGENKSLTYYKFIISIV